MHPTEKLLRTIFVGNCLSYNFFFISFIFWVICKKPFCLNYSPPPLGGPSTGLECPIFKLTVYTGEWYTVPYTTHPFVRLIEVLTRINGFLKYGNRTMKTVYSDKWCIDPYICQPYIRSKNFENRIKGLQNTVLKIRVRTFIEPYIRYFSYGFHFK